MAWVKRLEMKDVLVHNKCACMMKSSSGIVASNSVSGRSWFQVQDISSIV